jgi:hypothetical protein
MIFLRVIHAAVLFCVLCAFLRLSPFLSYLSAFRLKPWAILFRHFMADGPNAERQTASKPHSHRPQDLQRHLWINLIRAVVSTNYRPVLLVGEIQHINPQFDVLPSIKDASI